MTGVSSGAVGGVPAATDGEDPDDRDQLTSEHDAHHVDGRIPGHGAVLDAEDADGSDDDTEAEAGAGTGARRVRCGTFAAAAPTTAAHGGDGNDGDTVGLVGIAEGSLDVQDVPYRIELRQRRRELAGAFAL